MTNEELERLARAAADNWPDGVWVEADGRNLGVLDDADTAFIAAASPATILSLLSERAELLAAVERMRGALIFYADHPPVFPPSDGPWGAGSTDFGQQARAALTTGEEK